MPDDLTKRQSEYLEFIRWYIAEYQCAPQLNDIAKRFDVNATSAHAMLTTLEEKGYLYFDRDDHTGFYLRLFEKIGTNASASEIVISGKLDRYGEIQDFPEKIGHFPFVLGGIDPTYVFAIEAWQHIPEASILGRDIIVFDQSKEPHIGDIGILPVGDRWFLVNFVDAQEHNLLLWNFLAESDDVPDYFAQLRESTEIPPNPIASEYVLASAIVVKRRLSI